MMVPAIGIIIIRPVSDYRLFLLFKLLGQCFERRNGVLNAVEIDAVSQSEVAGAAKAAARYNEKIVF